MDDPVVVKFDDSAAVAVVLLSHLVKKMVTVQKKKEQKKKRWTSVRARESQVESESLASIVHCIASCFFHFFSSSLTLISSA
jgi:predicted transcriptional regulator